MSDQEFNEYLDFAKGLALEAGEIMRRYFRSNEMATVWKADNTPVTVADEKINSLVIEKINRTYPSHGVLGEEESSHSSRSDLWVCDPLDGTMPFTAGLPLSTFSLAYVKHGQPMVGVVYDPYGERLFYASAGQGAYLNDSKIQVSASQSLKNTYINMETWGTKRANYDNKIIPIEGLRDRLMDEDAKPFSLSAMVISGALVAEGKLSGSIFGVRKPEDIAALKVIVEEAGGKVTDLDGNNQPYNGPINGAIVSNGLIHDNLIKLVSYR